MTSRLLVATALLLAASGASAQFPSELQGTWSGAVIEAGTPRLISLTFDTRHDRLLTTLTQPYSGFDTFPYEFFYLAPEEDASGDGFLVSELFGDMRLLVDLAEMNLRGTVSREDSVVATVFLQKVVSFPLPAIGQREFRIASGADTLAGSLVFPASPAHARGPHPTVVMVGGRGYGDRGDAGWLAALYARHGIAAVIWDGRGRGQSSGDAATVTSAQRIADVGAILDWALAQPEIDPAQVGVQANSAGGWIAPLALDERDDVAFLITTVGPAEPLAEQQGHTTTQLMEDSDSTYSDAEYEAAFAYQRDLVYLAQRNPTLADLKALNAAARGTRWEEHALIPDTLGTDDLDYYARMPNLDPRGALSRWRKPFLALYGDADWIVPPQHNVPLLRELTAENARNTTIEILRMGHALERPGATVGEGTWPQQYRRPWTRVPELFETLLAWLDTQTLTAAER